MYRTAKKLHWNEREACLTVHIRKYNPSCDREAVHRIWREVGWLEKGHEEAADLFIEAGRALVAEIHSEAECLALTVPGTVRYLSEDLPASFVTGATTSRVARKQGLASSLTARIVAEDAAEGALISALGMFEQGYYNQLGFGTGSYDHSIRFDPAHLRISGKARVPSRVSEDDWKAAHAVRLARWRGHGGCNLAPPQLTRAEMMVSQNGFGLGYRDDATGELTHYFWCEARNVVNGPYNIQWMAFRTWEQFLELMALIQSMGDQVHLITMQEPAGIQLQDFLHQPLKHHRVTQNSRFEGGIRAAAYWQVRICDLIGCLAHTHLQCEEVRFNLHLTDPIERFLNEDAPWKGISGDYVVTLSSSSGVESGMHSTLPTLRASVGAFTRIWLGVRPATGLAITDDLSGPPELLEQLDEALRLPNPKPDWVF